MSRVIAAEVVALEADEADPTEMRAVAELMEHLRPEMQRGDIYELLCWGRCQLSLSVV